MNQLVHPGSVPVPRPEPFPTTRTVEVVLLDRSAETVPAEPVLARKKHRLNQNRLANCAQDIVQLKILQIQQGGTVADSGTISVRSRRPRRTATTGPQMRIRSGRWVIEQLRRHLSRTYKFRTQKITHRIVLRSPRAHTPTSPAPTKWAAGCCCCQSNKKGNTGRKKFFSRTLHSSFAHTQSFKSGERLSHLDGRNRYFSLPKRNTGY